MTTGQLTHLQMMRYSVAQDGTIALKESATFEAQINPDKFDHSYGISYNKKFTLGDPAINPRFSAVTDEKVSFTIVLDGTGVVPPSGSRRREDVKTQIKQLNSVVFDYSATEREPPFVRLLWGSLIFFGRLESIDTKYTLFKPTGEPLRAQVNLKFVRAVNDKEAKLAYKPEPEDAVRRVDVREGDTLALLCHQNGAGGDGMAKVARHNNLDNLFVLVPGAQLVVQTRG